MSKARDLADSVAAGSVLADGVVSLSEVGGGTNNGVVYVNGSGTTSSGSALTFDGSTLIGTASDGTNNYKAKATSGVMRFTGYVSAFSGSLIEAVNGAESAYAPLTTVGSYFAWNNGSEQMRLTSTGLGIGTSSPFAKLQVVAASADYFNPQLMIGEASNSTGKQLHVGYNTTANTGYIQAVHNGTGYKDLLLQPNGGNLGLGVTPSAWTSIDKAFEIGRAGNGMFSGGIDDLTLSANAYYQGGWKYGSTGYANRFNVGSANGSFQWYTAPSGTAGNAISFTQAMTLDASGNLGIGTSSPTDKLHVDGGASSTYIKLVGQSATAYFGQDTVGLTVYQKANKPIYFVTNDTERARIDSSGSFGVGTSSPSTYGRVVSSGGTFSLVTDTASQRRLSFWSTANGNSENAYIQVQNDGATTNTGEILFATKNSGGTLAERARIDSSGNLLVGTTSNSRGGRIEVTGIVGGWGQVFKSPSNGGTYYHIDFCAGTTGSTEVGSITSSGTSTSYNTSSDYRLKNTIAPMTGALAKVAALKPVTYKWNADGSDGEGFIAHELAEVCPQAVTGEKDAVDADGNPVYQGIDTSFLVATLTAAIQELKAEFDAYKASHP